MIDAFRAIRHGPRVIILGHLLLLLSATGTLCLCVAAGRAASLRRSAAASPARRAEPVSIMKPLYGAEPMLFENLATFLAQEHDGAVQLVCGVQDARDEAVAVVDRLRVAHPLADIALVIDATRHGANAKVGNLMNMIGAARHELLILSDSDMAVPRDYLARLLSALDDPRVAAVTCLYRGRGDAGGWSMLAAMGISQHFLPGVLLGTALRLATPCMGSTIALSRTTLGAIGGLRAFADLLADDYAIGQAVRMLGQGVSLPPLLPAHGCAETSFTALVRQELRWNRTILSIDPAGFVGSIVLHPLPLALLGALLLGATPLAGGVAAAAFVARVAVAWQVDRWAGERTGPLAWVPLRDLLSFALYFGTFRARSVDWRGAALTLGRGGRMTAGRDKPERDNHG